MTDQRPLMGAGRSRHPEVLAFRCDREGIVLDVFADELRVDGDLRPGQTLLAIIDPHSHQKARQFLEAVQARQAASGWELTVLSGGRPLPAVFTGAAREDHLFVVAGRSGRDITDVVETLEQINNEQMNSFRAAFREQMDAFQQKLRAQDASYERLTELNNALSNAQRELSQKSAELERLNEEKNRFMGMAAHDLRNPLTVILGYASYLLQEEESDPEKRRMVQEIARSSRFMLDLITQLLDVSRIEAGGLDLQLSTFDAVPLVERCVASQSAAASLKRIEISCQAEQRPIMITSDSGKLSQVINNLINNAVKYSPPGSPVHVATRVRGQDWELIVEDRGIGIPGDQQALIFQPFVRLAGAGTAGEQSTGLGLSIVWQLMQLLGGTVEVESKVGEGSRFHVKLPLQARRGVA